MSAIADPRRILQDAPASRLADPLLAVERVRHGGDGQVEGAREIGDRRSRAHSGPLKAAR